MKFEQLAVLLPCYSLETFDLQWKEEDAEQLLGAWSVLWHPALLAAARAIPRWLPAGSPPEETSGYLMILPRCSASSLPNDWLVRAEACGACVLQKLPDRDAMLAAALERLGDDRPELDGDLARDFLALGFCHFQVELLTRKLRYMSNLDETSLRATVLAATDELLRGDEAAARKQLQAAFDRLHEAREYFYPTAARILDWTLVAPGTIGAALRGELSDGSPRNLLASGEVIEKMADCEPATLEALQTALAEKKASLIGGEQVELPLPLFTAEALQRHLGRGIAIYENLLGRRPKVFARRQFGLTAGLPRILERTGFTAALHGTLDDGQFPKGNQSRIQWEGIDGTTIEALGALPIDAGRADSFLRLPEILANAMNLDHTNVVMFAHWPGKASRWYEDLRRIGAYGTVLGTFLTIDDYFEQTALAGQRNHYQPDQYRSPYLAQDVAAERPDPISRWRRYYKRRAMLETIESLETLAGVIGGTANPADERAADENASPAMTSEELEAAIEDSLSRPDAVTAIVDDRLDERLQASLAAFASRVTGPVCSAERGWLVINPCSFPQQAVLPPSTSQPAPSLIEAPAMGFAWTNRQVESPRFIERKGWFGRRRTIEAPPLAAENTLRNEFFDVRFDPLTGAIRTISDYQSRDPRLAQQIALRLPQQGFEPAGDENYSIMAADALQITSAGPQLGEMLSRGRLLDREGRRVAEFQQTTRLWRGSRILEIEINLEIERQPEPSPWNSYYAARFAWKDETAKVHRGVHWANLPTELTQFESPHFVDICRKKQRTTLLFDGLPYHRRFGSRRLDTLLVVRGETARSFRLRVGFDLPNSLSAALGFLAPPLPAADQPAPPTSSGWLFHLDCRNVLATHWSPLANGFRVRLAETDGRGVRLGLRCWKAVASAMKINPQTVPPMPLVVEGDRIDIPIGPYQWIEVEAYFA
jgi:alpha-mannosidase